MAGGPGNKPTCAGQTLRAIGSELTGGFIGSQTAETSLKAASVYQAGVALNYDLPPFSAQGIIRRFGFGG
jgi:hypothetical protein